MRKGAKGDTRAPGVSGLETVYGASKAIAVRAIGSLTRISMPTPTAPEGLRGKARLQG